MAFSDHGLKAPEGQRPKQVVLFLRPPTTNQFLLLQVILLGLLVLPYIHVNKYAALSNETAISDMYLAGFIYAAIVTSFLTILAFLILIILNRKYCVIAIVLLAAHFLLTALAALCFVLIITGIIGTSAFIDSWNYCESDKLLVIVSIPVFSLCYYCCCCVCRYLRGCRIVLLSSTKCRK